MLARGDDELKSGACDEDQQWLGWRVSDGVLRMLRRCARELRVGDNYLLWLDMYGGVDDPQVIKAALMLKACLEGERTLLFTGDRVRLQRLLHGEGTASESLPIPAKNHDREFAETDRLILDTTAAGALADYRLVERPILGHPQHRFQGCGKTLIDRGGSLRCLRVSLSGAEIKLTPITATTRRRSIFNQRMAQSEPIASSGALVLMSETFTRISEPRLEKTRSCLDLYFFALGADIQRPHFEAKFP